MKFDACLCERSECFCPPLIYSLVTILLSLFIISEFVPEADETSYTDELDLDQEQILHSSSCSPKTSSLFILILNLNVSADLDPPFFKMLLEVKNVNIWSSKHSITVSSCC